MPRNTNDTKPLTFPASSRGVNNFTIDRNMRRYLRRVYPAMLQRQEETLESLGGFCGDRLDAQAAYSDRIAPPVLRQELNHQTAPEKRVGRVYLNDEYKDCQQEIYRHGVIAKCFDAKNPEPHMLAFIAQYLTSYSDISTGCPLAMTHPDALVLAARAPQNIRDRFLPQLLRTDGGTMVGGTWATEWAGGSDVRGNTKTVAVVADEKTGRCLVDGRNFFTSATGFDSWGAIKTVQMGRGKNAGIGLVFISRFTDEKWDEPASQRCENHIDVKHLKEKAGTNGLATAEVEMDGAEGWLIAGPKDGLRVMMEALGCSRVHNAMAAAGVMHRAYVEAMCWANNRTAFNDKVASFESVRHNLMKLKTEWSAGSALAFEAARTFDDALRDKEKRLWLRVATALAKYRTADQAVKATTLATKIIAGLGYTKDHPIERINRDALVLAVWEGPETIQARELMGVLRAGGDQAFIARIDSAIAQLDDQETSWEKSRLTYIRGKLASALSELRLCPEKDDMAAIPFIEDLSTALTYALLCEEAAAEIRFDNDRTKQFIARAYYEDHYRTEIRPALARSDLQRHFNEVAAGLPIPARPEGAQAQVSAAPVPPSVT